MNLTKETVIPWRKNVPSLQSCCQIEVLKALHAKAKHLRNDYFEEFSLKLRLRSYEPAADIRPENGIDPKAFVEDFEAKMKAKEERELKAKKNVKSQSRKKEVSRREGLRDSTKQQRRHRPYDVPSSASSGIYIFLIAKSRENESISFQALLLQILKARSQ